MAALLGSLSQQVQVDEVGMQSTYPVWMGCAGRSAGPMSSALNLAPPAKGDWCTTWSAKGGIASFCPCG